MANRRHRNWVFTLNNPDVKDDTFRVAGAKFLSWQVEKGTSGTEHIQATLVLENNCTLGALRRRIPGAHLEVMEGSLEQACHYSEKPHVGCDCKHCEEARKLPNDGRVAGPWNFGEKPVGQGILGERRVLTNPVYHRGFIIGY